MNAALKHYGARLAILAGLAMLSAHAAAQDEAASPFPDLPATPVLSGASYPDCREDYRDFNDEYDRAEDTNRCIQLLDRYFEQELAEFRLRMIAHQEAINTLYEEAVANPQLQNAQAAERFFERTTQEHLDSNPDGPHMEDYRILEARYQDDRAFLQERFCRYAGTCEDYEPTAITAERDRADGTVVRAERERRRRERRAETNSCNTERTGGGLLGGILGGVIGEATGLGAEGGILAGALGGLLVAEIACQLTAEEQEKVAEATAEVTAQEEVGATAEWVSPTRADVSGSSTVTALVSQPNGASCMDVTDIVIVEGEETRVSKRMCREPGESRYTLAA